MNSVAIELSYGSANKHNPVKRGWCQGNCVFLETGKVLTIKMAVMELALICDAIALHVWRALGARLRILDISNT